MSDKEILVAEDWDSGDVTCDRCGEELHLYFNGGELDGRTCKCGRTWFTREYRIDLWMRETDE